MQDSLSEEIYDVIVLGAGAAGLMAAMGAAEFSFENKKRILILEKMQTPGKKLLISGSGRCNVTHAGAVSDFFTHYGPHERFVKPALLNFTNENLVQFLTSRGLPCIQLNDGKIFPKSERARDVLNVFLSACTDFRISIELNHKVLNIVKNNETGIFEISCENQNLFLARRVILTTGGKSYPTTGSTGDGVRLAQTMGHSQVPMKPGLTPIIVSNFRFASCAGIALPDAPMVLFRAEKKVASHSGDVLFTHHGLSGPGILDFSRYFEPNDILQLAPVPNLNDECLSSVIQKNPQREIGNLIRTEFGLPDRLCAELLAEAGVSDVLKCWEITKKMRKSILKILTLLLFPIHRVGDFREAMVTVGGIPLAEVNRQTMESRLVSGLYFAGEILDVDGDTGGYNLQFAFSSGVLAGQNAAATLTNKIHT